MSRKAPRAQFARCAVLRAPKVEAASFVPLRARRRPLSPLTLALRRPEKLASAKQLVQEGKVGAVREEDAGSGRVAAEVQGTEPYSVTVSLRGNGEWGDTSCSCPDGTRTSGKCKHVGAVLLRAAASSAPKKCAADVVVVLDDSDDEPQPRTSAPKAAAARKSPPPPAGGAQAAHADARGLVVGGGEAAPALAGGLAATDVAKPATSKPKRVLPSWMMKGPARGASKPTAGDEAAAKAAKMVGKKPPAKRKAAAAPGADSGGEEPAPKKKGPRSRPTAATARKKGNGAQPDATSQAAASSKKPTQVTDLMDDSEGMGLLDDLCADDGEVPGTVAAADEPAARSSGRQRECSSPQRESKPQSGQKGKEECVDNVKRSASIYSSASPSIPDTPEAAAAPATASESEGKAGSSSVRAPAHRLDSDDESDSDDEDPAAKWRRRMEERRNKSASQPNSQASPSGSLTSARHAASAVRADGTGSDDDVAIVQIAKGLPGECRDKYASKGAACTAASPSPSEGTRSTRCEVSRRHSRSRSPPARTLSPSSKPVVSLADRMKAIRGY